MITLPDICKRTICFFKGHKYKKIDYIAKGYDQNNLSISHGFSETRCALCKQLEPVKVHYISSIQSSGKESGNIRVG